VNKPKNLKFIDLFAGVGGFHYAMGDACQRLGLSHECVFASDIDDSCRENYSTNFDIAPVGDITKFDEIHIPEHDVLLAGFPCQAFSIIGDRKGFEDTRGTLFFDIARILKFRQPKLFILENVKQLRGHDKGQTLKVILETCKQLGYKCDYFVLNALDFGLPQKRERIFIVGWRDDKTLKFDFENLNIRRSTLDDVLELDVDKKYFASAHILAKRKKAVKVKQISHGRNTIWHENKNGNISAYEYSCALRAGASHNYLLVNGVRRLTEREMMSLQGFPKHHTITGTYNTVKKHAGNSLPIPMASEVIFQAIRQLWSDSTIGTAATFTFSE